jgi:hypothetical protein
MERKRNRPKSAEQTDSSFTATQPATEMPTSSQPANQVASYGYLFDTIGIHAPLGVTAQREKLKDEDQIPVQAFNDSSAAPNAEASVSTRIQNTLGTGQPLDSGAREVLEPKFAHSFENVRIHADGEADALSKNLGARAFTTGQDIFFRSGEYQPGSSGGQHLLAHELTHTIQQARGSVDGMDRGDGIRVSDPSDSFEREAVTNARRLNLYEPVGNSMRDLQENRIFRVSPNGNVQRDQMGSQDSTNAFAARTSVQVTRLIEDIVRAIARNEIGGQETAMESGMQTSSGASASYASASQMIPSRAIGVLRRSENRSYASEHGLTLQELNGANNLIHKSHAIWNAIVHDGHDFTFLQNSKRSELDACHFTESDVEKMLTFRKFKLFMQDEYTEFLKNLHSHLPEVNLPQGFRSMTSQQKRSWMRSHNETYEKIWSSFFGISGFSQIGDKLEFSKSTMEAYFHLGTFGRWAEDMNSWSRVALNRNQSLDQSGRTVAERIENAAEAENGFALTRLDFKGFIRRYIFQNPTQSDREVCRSAANSNAADKTSGYSDRILTYFDQIHQ